MFKKIICIIASLILCLTCFIVPSFASNDPILIPVNPLSFNTNRNSEFTKWCVDNGYNVNSSGVTRSYFTCSYSGTNTYIFRITNDNNLYYASSSNSGFNFTAYLNGSNYDSNGYNQSPTLDSDSGLYYGMLSLGSLNSDIPIYSSLSDGLSAVNNIIDGGSSSSYSDTISINPGQVAYIGFPISASYSITANTEMPKISTGGGWSDSPQRWGASATLPESGTTFPISGSIQIPWNVVGSTNMFGQGVSAEWSVSNILATDFRFIYIYNPWYYQEGISSPSIYSSSGNLTINTNPITVDVSGYSSIRIFNLQQSVTGEGIYVSSSLSGFEDYQEVIPSSESGSGEVEYEQYTNGVSTGDPSIINNPNNNQYNPNPMTVTEHIQQVTAVLSNFANSLIELIKAPISHVAQLIQAGSGFMASLRGMYAWLPVDIQGLVTSALSLVIGIGVFKVFL